MANIAQTDIHYDVNDNGSPKVIKAGDDVGSRLPKEEIQYLRDAGSIADEKPEPPMRHDQWVHLQQGDGGNRESFR